MNNLRWLTEQIYDLSLATHGIRPGTGGEPVAIIAMDGRNLASEELAATPRILFGSFCAKLIDGLGGADFKAVGCDIIFSYLANRFPALPAQYDRSLYGALARHYDRLVLARSAALPVAAPIEAAVYDLDEDAWHPRAERGHRLHTRPARCLPC